MSCKLSDIARAKSSSDTVANASSISLDIFSRSPPCTSGLLTDPGDHGLVLPYDACDRDSDGGLSPNRIPPAKCGDVGWSQSDFDASFFSTASMEHMLPGTRPATPLGSFETRPVRSRHSATC